MCNRRLITAATSLYSCLSHHRALDQLCTIQTTAISQSRTFSSTQQTSTDAATPVQQLGFVSGGYELSMFPPDRIRTFSIIAHVDHGKSTLADRLMEFTGAIKKGAAAQYLDKLQVERERGITVKAQTASLVYRHKGKEYLLNLVDTPGHVDFSYEVSRSLAACQGALLLVDSSQGVQAQTVANFYLAFEQGLDIVPVLNKVDLPSAEPERVAAQMSAMLDMSPSDMLRASGKTGLGLADILEALVSRVRPPPGDPSAPLRMLLFDAFHDEYRGVVCLVAVVDGALRRGDRITAASSGEDHEVLEVGILAPEMVPTPELLTGQVGYIITGLKDVKAARVGDTLHRAKQPVAALPGFKPAKSNVYAGLYPLSGDAFEALAYAIDKLTLNDASVVVRRESSDALGAGFRCGFLGMLHMEVFMQRLEQEFGAGVVATAPTVPYKLRLPGGEERTLETAAEFPEDGRGIAGIMEPTVLATVVLPSEHLGRIMTLCQERRGVLLEQAFTGAERVLLRYELPLAELGGDFYGRLKAASAGYASFDYEEGPYRDADLQRLDILVNGKVVDALARMVHRSAAQHVGRSLAAKLKDMLDQQQFEIVIHAAANGRVIARESLKALRKNVLAKCYGGDVSRKRKLLEKQKEGKKRMRRMGDIDVPQEVFPELMRIR